MNPFAFSLKNRSSRFLSKIPLHDSLSSSSPTETQMGSLQNPAVFRSQSSLRRSALCVVVLAVSFFACLYLKTPLQTDVKNSDVYSSPSPVYPPRRRLTGVNKFDSLQARAKSVDIDTSIREYIEGRYLTQLALNGTIDTNPFTLHCFYAADMDSIEGIRLLVTSSSTGLLCSTGTESDKILPHSSWVCLMDMAHNNYFIVSRSEHKPQESGKPLLWQQVLGLLDVLRMMIIGPTSESITLPPKGTQFSGSFRGIVYKCYKF